MSDIIHKYSAGGLIVHKGKVLTISWLNEDYICFPKGGIEKGETSEQAAIREVFEETGYKASVISFICSLSHFVDKNDKSYNKTVDYYLMELINDDLPTPHREPDENFDNLWLSFEEADSMLTFDDAKQTLKRALDFVNKY